MPLSADYGDTPVDPDDAVAFTPTALKILGDSPTKADVYDVEQAILADVAEEHLSLVAAGDIELDELLTDAFARALHGLLYGDLWEWAGTYRTRELAVGVAPELVAISLRESLETIRYRWTHTSDWTPRQLGMVVHAETVRVHPFVDGNGRTTRLLADLVYLAAQSGESLRAYDWAVEKAQYVRLLREYDRSRDVSHLAAFVPTVSLEA